MSQAIFISDIHGSVHRCEKLYEYIINETPEVVFIGGDILPNYFVDFKVRWKSADFLKHYFAKEFRELKNKLKDKYPEVFLILGNDDPKYMEKDFINYERLGAWKYIHNKSINYKDFKIYGYSYVPPTPFLLKDWEKYDVSQYVDPGCIHPTEGKFTIDIDVRVLKYSTIKEDLNLLTGDDEQENSIFLFHSPPHQTNLDKINGGGKMFDGIPIDTSVGSIAIKNFIEEKQPLLTLHGHIHESSEVSGEWKDIIGNTPCVTAAYNHSQLSLIKFELENPEKAERILL